MPLHIDFVIFRNITLRCNVSEFMLVTLLCIAEGSETFPPQHNAHSCFFDCMTLTHSSAISTAECKAANIPGMSKEVVKPHFHTEACSLGNYTPFNKPLNTWKMSGKFTQQLTDKGYENWSYLEDRRRAPQNYHRQIPARIAQGVLRNTKRLFDNRTDENLHKGLLPKRAFVPKLCKPPPVDSVVQFVQEPSQNCRGTMLWLSQDQSRKTPPIGDTGMWNFMKKPSF